jgi:1,6-anhydro-N-acetylmuramate kinase
MERSRLVLGAMTGTSIDGIDLAVVRILGSGLAMRAEPVAFRSAGLDDLAPRLRAAADQQPMSAGQFAELARDLGILHAREARALLRESGIDRVDLAALHGQTVFHRPPCSWQLLNAHPVAAELGCDVVFDLRGHDLAAGGQGAPLTPLADWVLLRAPHARAVVNLGGFANATLLPADDGSAPASQVAAIRGADLCACNQLLDRAARAVLGREFDADGAAAARGTPDAAQLDALAGMLAPPGDGRSLGTGDELGAWVSAASDALAPQDLLATAAEAIGRAVGAALRDRRVQEVIVAGGGARHRPLLQAIARAAGCPVRPSDDMGLPVGSRECVGWAVLGALAQDRVEIALPAVTGRRSPTRAIAGTWQNAIPD